MIHFHCQDLPAGCRCFEKPDINSTMNTIETPPPAMIDCRDTVLLRLEACTDRDGWKLSQLDGQTLPRMPMTFGARSEAVDYAKTQCRAIGCNFVIRTANRFLPAA